LGPIVLGVLFGLYFLNKRFWRELVLVALVQGGGGLLFLILSETFMRPRPFILFSKLIWNGGPNIPGFPSGHAIGIVVLCGFLVYLISPKIKSYLGKVLIVLLALLMILYIGIGQIYLGDHYLTDIIAGYAIGIAWFGISVTFVELLFKRNNSNKEAEGHHENYRKSYGQN
jgi:membrane-associated phospholipid phosphatase